DRSPYRLHPSVHPNRVASPQSHQPPCNFLQSPTAVRKEPSASSTPDVIRHTRAPNLHSCTPIWRRVLRCSGVWSPCVFLRSPPAHSPRTISQVPPLTKASPLPQSSSIPPSSRSPKPISIVSSASSPARR